VSTTGTSFATKNGITYQTIVAIEGYGTLITDGAAGGAEDAWTGTDWGGAMTGLYVDWGGMDQSLAPWTSALEPMTVTLKVANVDPTYDLGVVTSRPLGGTSTRLTANMSPVSIGAAVRSTAEFGGTGYIHIGTEQMYYDGTGTYSATSFATLTRGLFAPFPAEASGTNFARSHRVPNLDNIYEARLQPEVTSVQRQWIGRHVGIWLHEMTSGVACAKADAHLAFAGTITSIRDTSDGSVLIECSDFRRRILDASLLREQYVGRVQEGIYLLAGDTFTASDNYTGSGGQKNTTLTVLASGAATEYQVDEGWYTLTELEAKINIWLGKAKADAALYFTWFYTAAFTDTNGTRGKFTWQHSTANVSKGAGFVAPARVIAFMGWSTRPNITAIDTGNSSWSDTSPEEPYRIIPPTLWGSSTMRISDHRGTWFDNTATLPSSLTQTSGVNWGVVKLSTGDMLLVQKASDTAFTVVVADELKNLGASPATAFLTSGVRWSQAGEIEATQIALIEGTLLQILSWFLFSSGSDGYNSAIYDLLPEQLGAGIPYAVFGDEWVASVEALQDSTNAGTMTVMLEKPTRLWDVVAPDLVLRMAHLVWKDQRYRLSTWATPAIGTSLFDLTEANKSRPSGTVDALRAPTETTADYMVNAIKVRYNRDVEGNYRDSVTIYDAAAIADAGEKMITVEARNSFGGLVTTGAAIEDLVASVGAMLPMFSRPLRKLRRSIGIEHILTMAPGDQCNVTDNFARNPITGARGLSAIPGLIVRHSWNLGGKDGSGSGVRPITAEVDLIVQPSNRVATYSPAAEMASYNAGTKVITTTAHAYSLSTDVNDSARFVAGDAVQIVEIDPSNPAAPYNTVDIIAGVGTNTLTLTTGLPVGYAGKTLRIMSLPYSTSTSTQKAHVYQADDADGRIQDLASAYVYGLNANFPVTGDAADPANPVALYSTYAYGDGIPLDTGYEQDIAKLANNLVHYSTSPMAPHLHSASFAPPAGTGYVRSIVQLIPVYLGIGKASGFKRRMWVAPFARNTSAGSSRTITVSLCRYMPYGTSWTITSTSSPEYALVRYVSVTFTLSASSGWSRQTAQAIDIRHCDLDRGEAFVVVECEPELETYGLAEMRLGPWEAA